MKKFLFFIVYFLQAIYLNASEPKNPSPILEVKPSPPLRLTQTYPIEINDENRKVLYGNEKYKQEAQRNQEIFQRAAFPWLLLLLMGMFILIASAVIWYGTHVPKRLETEEERKKRIQDQALNAIKNLKASTVDPKQYFIKLSDIVRHYIAEQYQLPVMTQTKQELLQTLGSTLTFNEKMCFDLNHFFSEADLVKFAHERPSIEQCEQAKSLAIRLFTIQVP